MEETHVGRLKEVAHHGTWAKVTVEVKTAEGVGRETFTVVSIGRNWFFYHPGADRELVPTEE